MRFAHLGLAVCALTMIAGCEDDPPPLARGGWTVTFVSGGADCSLSNHTANVGNVTSDKKDLKTNGADDSDIECQVSSSSIGGSAFRKSSNLDITVGSISADATSDNPATGTVFFVSPNTIDGFASPAETPCEFWFDEGTDQGIQPGEAWFAFRCPVVESEGRQCAIQQGYAAFENCE